MRIAARLAIAVGVAGTQILLGSCAETGKSVTAPSRPRAETIPSNGFGNAGLVRLCVSASSPGGAYTFANSHENDGIGVDGLPDPGTGGTGTTLFNVPNDVPYILMPGMCVDVLNRVIAD